MVRNLVGAAVSVGEGRFPSSRMVDLLNNQERVTDSYVFPARGLTLVGVDYPSEDQLIERAKIAMAKRVDD